MNIAQWEIDHVQAFGERAALIAGTDVWTSRELYEQAARLAHGLGALGVAPGDRVVIALPNCRELFVASSAALLAGAVLVVLPDVSAAEVERISMHCGARALFARRTLLGPNGMDHVARRIVVGPAAAMSAGCEDFEALVDAHSALASPVARAADDVAQLCYTSGTTGAPRGVAYTHGGIDAYLRMCARAPSWSQPNTILAAAPPTAFGARLISLRVTGPRTYVLHERFDPYAVLGDIERHRIAEMALVPTMAEQLVARAATRDYDCSSLRTIIIGGSHVSQALVAKLRACVRGGGARGSSLARSPASRGSPGEQDLDIAVHYGMTETGGGFASTTVGGDGVVGTVAPNVTVRIVDDEERDVAAGSTGEIVVRTPYAAVGYWNEPERTAAVFRDGFIWTGDLGYMNAEGLLCLVGRKKDVIVQGAYKISPQEVVDVINAVEGVERSLVVGVPNELLGEEAVACVVRSAGSEVSAKDIRSRCRALLDPRKRPARIVFLDEFPVTPAGKADVKALRGMIADATREPARGLVAALHALEPARRRASIRAAVEETLVEILAEDSLPLPDPGAFSGSTFGELGVDSSAAVRFSHALGRRFGNVLSPVLLYSYPSVRALSEQLAELLFADAAAPPTPTRTNPFVEPTAAAAIVGIGCRLPGGAHTPDAFWEMLAAGVDAVSAAPPGRSSVGGAGRGAFVSDVDRFDAHFFRLAAEAADLDPRHRMLLEVAWEALEDAGIDPLGLDAARTGVFLGIYGERYASGNVLGTAPGMAVARLCHFLNLRGPVLSIDTTCSSSLVALHCAALSLRSGECDTAIVAGANLLASSTVPESLGVLSPSGRSRAFDAGADGFGQGEGCVVMVLRRRSLADAGGSRSHAIVLGTAINHDGRSRSLTAPNPGAQQEVIAAALQSAGIGPDDVQYVEAHGTGTVIGDPIEVEGLTRVFGARAGVPALAIGSVKTNIGHLEAAAGLAGVLKVVLAMRHRRLPASLHFDTPNPHIPWTKIPIVVQREAGDWPRPHLPLVAGVSSFGMSGTNAHAVVMEVPRDAPDRWAEADALAEKGTVLALPLSARSIGSLRTLAARYAAHRDGGPFTYRDVAYTAGCGRAQLEHRATVLGGSLAELATGLRRVAEGRDQTITGFAAESRRDVVMVFGGQGTQWAGMARELFREEAVFRDALVRCAGLVQRTAGWSLLDEIDAEPAFSRLAQTEVAQPVLFAVQVALLELWRSWGVEPVAVIGHSLGEIAAAYAAGAMSLGEAAWLACERGRVMRPLHGHGTMAAVDLSEKDVDAFLAERYPGLDVAASNGPRLTVVSGPEALLRQALDTLASQGVRTTPLDTKYAFHSRHCGAAAEDLAASLGDWKGARPTVELISGATGEAITSIDAAYWCAQVRNRVRFHAAAQTALRGRSALFLEIDPHPVLLSSLNATIESSASSATAVAIGCLRRDSPERKTMLEALAKLYCAGYPVDWRRQYPSPARLADVPRYAWEHARYWREARHSQAARRGAPLLETVLASAATPGRYHCELVLDRQGRAMADLGHQTVHGRTVFSAAAFIELAAEAAERLTGRAACTLAGLELEQGLAIGEHGSPRVQIVLDRCSDGSYDFAVYSREDEAKPASRHLKGRVLVEPPRPNRLSLRQLEERAPRAVDVDDFYDRCACAGIVLGEPFQSVESVWAGDGEILARVSPSAEAGAGDYVLAPASFNAALLLAAVLPWAGATDESEPMLDPVTILGGLREACVLNPRSEPAWIHVERRERDGAREFDVQLLDAKGVVLLAIAGARCAALDERNSVDGLLYDLVWKPVPLGTPLEPEGRWLLLGNRSPVCESLARELASRGARAIIARNGSGYSRDGDSSFVLDARDPALVRRLLRDADLAPGARVVCLSSLDLSSADGDLDERCEDMIVAITHVAQALAEADKEMRLSLVTRDAHPAGGDSAGFAQAAIWGFGRALAREQSALAVDLIDLDSSDVSAASLCAALTQDDGEPEIALRRGERLAARLVRREAPAAVHGLAPLRADRTYLVAGASGGLGAAAVRWLAERGARNLVLVSRSAAGEQFVRLLTSLAERGVRTRVERADIADAGALADVLAGVAAQMPPVAGVIHAAGALRDGAIGSLDAVAVRSVMRAKVSGAWNLHRLTRDLDFFVLFSSAVGVVGNAGQTNYAAANAFLDALCHYRRSRGLPAHSIDWCAWKNVGMAAGLRTSAAPGITPTQGMAVLEHLAGDSRAQTVVLTPEALCAIKRGARSAPSLLGELFAKRRAREGVDVHAETVRAIREAAAGERATLLERYLTREVGAFMRTSVERIDASSVLDTLGIDSLATMHVRTQVAERFGVKIPAASLRPGATFGGLVDAVLAALGARDRGVDGVSPQLVRLRSQEHGLPVVFVHPVGGSVACYEPLARALDNPVAAIESGMLHGTPAAATVEEMAQAYLEVLRAEGYRQPFVLAGWSLGGLIAYEMAARVAEAEGRAVALTVLIDARFTTGDATLDGLWRDYVRRATRGADADRRQKTRGEHASGMAQHDAVREFVFEVASALDVRARRRLDREVDALLGAEAGSAAAREAVVRRTAAATGARPDLLERLLAGYLANMSAIERYRPRRYEGDVFQVRASASPGDDWKRVAPNLHVEVLEGDHYSIMKPPAVDVLVDVLRARLDGFATTSRASKVQPHSSPRA